jgi:hypothetical protein
VICIGTIQKRIFYLGKPSETRAPPLRTHCPDPSPTQHKHQLPNHTPHTLTQIPSHPHKWLLNLNNPSPALNGIDQNKPTRIIRIRAPSPHKTQIATTPKSIVYYTSAFPFLALKTSRRSETHLQDKYQTTPPP